MLFSHTLVNLKLRLYRDFFNYFLLLLYNIMFFSFAALIVQSSSDITHTHTLGIILSLGWKDHKSGNFFFVHRSTPFKRLAKEILPLFFFSFCLLSVHLNFPLGSFFSLPRKRAQLTRFIYIIYSVYKSIAREPHLRNPAITPSI